MLGKYALLVNASMPETSGDDADMATKCRQTLAANLQALRASTPERLSQAAIGKVIGADQTTVSRILGGKHDMGIDKLDGLAKLFHLRPWQLLVPELVPGKPPEVAHFSPLALEVARLYDALAPHKQRLLFAQAQVLHNPDIDPDQAGGIGSTGSTPPG